MTNKDNLKSKHVTGVVILIKGILMILIGIIHTIAIYFEMQEAFKYMAEDWAVEYAIWFGATGAFFIFIGTIDLLSYPGLKKGAACAWRMAFCSSIFPALIVTPGAIYFLRDAEPAIVFPMTISLLGIVGSIVLLINHRRFTNSGDAS